MSEIEKIETENKEIDIKEKEISGKYSLRTQITVMAACALIVTMIIATVLGVYAIKKIGTENADEKLLLLCETGQKNLETYFKNVEQSVEMVQAYAEEDLDGLDDEHLQAHLDRVSDIFLKLTNHTSGILTYYYRIDPEVSENVKGFWYVYDGESFKEHEVTDITQYDTEDTSKLVWFTVPKATGEPVWLAPYITENLGAKVISFNTPVYYDGKFVGVIGIEIDYSTMADQVDNITLYENGYAFINDAEGVIIYHPRMDVTTMDEQPKVPEGLLGDKQLVTYTYDGVKKRGAWLPLSNGMRLNVTVPVSEINAAWQKWSIEIVVIFGILLILFILLIEKVTGRITKPLRDLTEMAEQVDEGNYDVSLDYNGPNEIGVLTRTFNKLITHLKTYISYLSDLAYADALTSVRNKGAFDIYMHNMQTEVDMSGKAPEFAVIMFDCNDLKAVNDNNGHDKGDIYLKESAEIICDVFEHSPVFRIGGDEFAAVLQNRDYKNRDELLRLFDKRCEEKRKEADDRWEQIDVARGMAAYDPALDESVNDVVHRADKLMYENKWHVKGKVVGEKEKSSYEE